MDEHNKPSRAMVSKLMGLNCIGPKLDLLMHDFPYTIALPYLQRKMTVEEAQKFLKKDNLGNAFAEVYGEFFTLDEILDLIAFYKSPLGKRLAQTDEVLRMKLLETATRIAIDTAVDIVKDSIDKT